MDVARTQKRLRRGAPDHDRALGTGAFLDLSDVRHELLGKVHLVLAFFDVSAVELFHVVLVEDRFERLDLLELVLELVNERPLEHSRMDGRLVPVVFEDVPGRKGQIGQGG